MQGLQASKLPKWHNFDFPAVRMIEVRNSSQPRDAASGILTHPSAFLTRYPGPHYPIPSTRLRYVILHPMPLPYTPELDPIPRAMAMRVVIAARLNFTQHCPTSPESDGKTFLGLATAFNYSTAGGPMFKMRGVSTSIHRERVRSCGSSLLWCNHLPKNSIEDVSSERLAITPTVNPTIFDRNLWLQQ